MKRPNFFIVGAPKCGTTALSEYLRAHPNIFICDPKEPHYFAEDMDRHRYVKTLPDYLNLFKYAGPEHAAVGEASVGYLLSSVAIGNIRQFDPDAKIIVMVRNPIDMALSSHRQLLFARYEDEPDFEKAWNLQASRRKGRNIPSNCRAPVFLQYAQSCRVGEQIQRLKHIFPQTQIKVIVFDDFVADTAKVYGEVLEFLGLPHDNRASFEKINEAKRYKYEFMADFVAASKPLAVSVAVGIRKLIGYNPLPLMKRILSLNETGVAREEISPGFRRRLAEEFRDDVELLSSLVGRDLTDWLDFDEH